MWQNININCSPIILYSVTDSLCHHLYIKQTFCNMLHSSSLSLLQVWVDLQKPLKKQVKSKFIVPMLCVKTPLEFRTPPIRTLLLGHLIQDTKHCHSDTVNLHINIHDFFFNAFFAIKASPQKIYLVYFAYSYSYWQTFYLLLDKIVSEGPVYEETMHMSQLLVLVVHISKQCRCCYKVT